MTKEICMQCAKFRNWIEMAKSFKNWAEMTSKANEKKEGKKKEGKKKEDKRKLDEILLEIAEAVDKVDIKASNAHSRIRDEISSRIEDHDDVLNHSSHTRIGCVIAFIVLLFITMSVSKHVCEIETSFNDAKTKLIVENTKMQEEIKALNNKIENMKALMEVKK